MADFWRRLVTTTLFCIAAGFVVLLVWSMIVFPSERVMSYFQWEWIMANTWAELLRLAPVAQAWAALLTFSWLVPAGSLSATTGKHSSLDRFGSSLIALLSFSLVYAIVFLVWSPAAIGDRSETEFATTLARNYYDLAEQAEESQNFGSAVSFLRQYDAVTNHQEPEIARRILDLRVKAVTDAVRDSVDSDAEPIHLPEGADAADLISRAVAALEQDDYSTAHYMATLARALDPDSTDAARITAEALRHLEDTAPTTEEGVETQFFRDLLSAKHAITRGDYVSAYYQLVVLQLQRPDDLDVRRYLALAADQAGGLAVFLDEAETAISLSEKQDLLFVNERTPDYTELVYVGAVTRYSGVVYVQQVEVFRLASDGTVLSDVTSPYGKIDNNHLILRVLNRDDPQLSQEPDYLVGVEQEPSGIIEITPNGNELMVLAAVARDVRSASIGDLFAASGLMESYGLPPEPLKLELVLRLTAPFTYILFGLFAIGLGWRYRTRYLHHPAIPTIILAPLLPVVLVPVYAALLYAQQVFAATFLLWTGQAGSIALALSLQAILLMLGLGYVALSTRE